MSKNNTTPATEVATAPATTEETVNAIIENLPVQDPATADAMKVLASRTGLEWRSEAGGKSYIKLFYRKPGEMEWTRFAFKYLCASQMSDLLTLVDLALGIEPVAATAPATETVTEEVAKAA